MLPAKQKITTFSLIVVCFAALFYLYDFVLQVSPGVMAGSLRQEFGINATSFGSIIGLYFYSYTAMQIPAGLLLDRFGARVIVCASIVCCAISVLIFACAPNIYFIALARFLMGGASAFSFLGTLYLILRLLPPATFAFFAGIAQLLSSLGAAVGETPLAYYIHFVGWRVAMGSLAIFGFLLALTLWILLGKSRVTRQPNPHKSKIIDRLKNVFRKKQTWFIATYAFAIWAPIVTFAGLWGIPFLERAYHLTNIQAATGVMLIWLSIGAACPVFGWLSDRMGKRKSPLVVVAIIGLIGSCSVIFNFDTSSAGLFISLAMIGIAASGQTLSFAIIKDNTKIYNTSAANGFNNMAVVLGGALFQPLVGKLLDLHWSGTMVNGIREYSTHDYQVALALVPACYILAIIMSLFFIKETNCLSIEHRFIGPRRRNYRASEQT